MQVSSIESCFDRAVGCSNDSRSVSKEHGISFHRLPTQNSLLQKWLAKISRVDFVVTKDTRLCSDHFEPDCFERDLKAERNTYIEAGCTTNNFCPSAKKEASTAV